MKILVRVAALSFMMITIGCAQMRSTSPLMSPGTKAPPIQAAGWLNGPPPDADALEGKVTVVDVWAFW